MNVAVSPPKCLKEAFYVHVSHLLPGEYSGEALQLLDVAGLHPGAHQEAPAPGLEREVSRPFRFSRRPHCPHQPVLDSICPLQPEEAFENIRVETKLNQ